MNIQVTVRPHPFLDLLRKGYKIDVRAPTRRAGNECKPFFFDLQCLKNLNTYTHFFHRVGGERDADGIAYTFG